MTKRKVYSEPSDVESKPGQVNVIGPDHVDIAFTPEAAATTAANLLDKAAEAKGQKAINADAARRGLRPPYQP